LVFLPDNINIKINIIFRARAELKRAAWYWTLIDNGKSANQIARLAAIVVKKTLLPDIVLWKINFFLHNYWRKRNIYSSLQ